MNGRRGETGNGRKNETGNGRYGAGYLSMQAMHESYAQGGQKYYDTIKDYFYFNKTPLNKKRS